ncbi:MAG: amidohydrolase [Acholeplasmataceae bacterium]|nr:amidohydrolase [Acholeplasmataceae bacterium]
MKLWTHGIFHTMQSEYHTHQSILTDHGVIVAVDDEINHHQADEIIDLGGLHVYPGFVDAHLHLLGYGQKLMRLNLENQRDPYKVQLDIKSNFRGEPLFVEGYFDVGLTKVDLNAISDHIPILLRHNDYHSVTVNSAILKQIHMEKTNGVLSEDDAQKAMDAFPKYSNRQLGELLHKAISKLYTYGVTGGHSDDLYYFNGFQSTLDVFENYLKKHPFRAHLLVHHKVLDDYIASKRPFLDQTPFLQLGAIKCFYDGTISSKTACFKHPYKNGSHHGIRILGKSGFLTWIKKIRKHDLPVAVHVIGDQGLREVVQVLKAYPPKIGLHDRIIHASFADEETMNIMKDIPIVLDIQPQFQSSDMPWALSYLSMEPEAIYPWKTYLKFHLKLAGSSDAPVEVPNPLVGMYAAMERRSIHDGKQYQIDEMLNRFEAISLYTTGSNRPTYHTNRGQIKKGYIADFTILRDDLMVLPIQEFLEPQVKMTVIDEKIVYKNDKI